MRVKFRLCLDAKGNRVTRVYFVESNGDLELLTQMKGWVGIDFDHMDETNVEQVASGIAQKTDDTKYIE